ncbi:MAG: phosphoenolpyruvate kinase [Acidobacteria bacterium]|nr:phosphoenolpyruvate kinase [Acidobacteriota bacterium]
MSKTIITEGDEGVQLIIKNRKGDRKKRNAAKDVSARSPVQVLYGGADRYSASTPEKMGKIALATLKTYAPNFVEFAQAVRLPGTETLPGFPAAAEKLVEQVTKNPVRAKEEDRAAWLAWSVYEKVADKLAAEPVEDLRIDFEDGYGFRPDEEEDKDAKRSAMQIAQAFLEGSLTAFSGIRIKPLSGNTYARAVSTYKLFTETFLNETNGRLPENFVVTLPKVTGKKDVKELVSLLKRTEKDFGLRSGSIGIELLTETPEVMKNGGSEIDSIVEAAKGRCTSIHFGAYDFTSALGIAPAYQRLDHPACDLARQYMQLAAARLGIRVSDSVTTLLPVEVHREKKLSAVQKNENRRSVHDGWRTHFANVTNALRNGFYQGWDVHPNQLSARYAAVYAFFYDQLDEFAPRLRRFIDASTQAVLTGTTFDDAASANGILNFFRKAVECSVLTEDEAGELIGCSAAEFRELDFERFGSV